MTSSKTAIAEGLKGKETGESTEERSESNTLKSKGCQHKLDLKNKKPIKKQPEESKQWRWNQARTEDVAIL